MKISKNKIERIAKEVIKKMATGEMSKKDIEKGGDWYESAKELENVAKSTGKFKEVRPFDQYQGPYALLTNGSKIWFTDKTETEGIYYLDEGKKGYELSEREIKDFYKDNAEKFIDKIKTKKPKTKVKKADVAGFMYEINVNIGKLESGQTDNKEYVNNNLKNLVLKNTGFKTEDAAVKDLLAKLTKELELKK